MFAILLLFAHFVAQPNVAFAQITATPADGVAPFRTQVRAARLTGALVLDGRLDEPAWREAPVTTEFFQREPDEDAPSRQETRVFVLYDEDALYVGARMLDTAPDSIVARLGRRDTQLESDYFAFFIDPYLDRRSGFYFAVTAAGTLLDGVLLNDDWDDSTWDGVWQGRAAIDDAGWSAELRIPYSQLRFHEREAYVWGVNFKRFIARWNEHAFLVYAPKNGSGFVSRFPELLGVEDIRPSRNLEVMPYVTTRAEYTHPEPNNPFRDGSRYVPGIGADVKVGLSTNLTLNATVNPDFGQVEVDPAVVNLSDFETFYDEKRPFFVEGASIFEFGTGGSHSNWGFNWSAPNFFYSRRVGRPPQGSVPPADYIDRPEVTRILGAAKISGRLAGDWNVGTIHALTGRESARVLLDGERDRFTVEAPAYYGVLRTQKEFDQGRRAIGLLSTVTARAIDEPALRSTLNAQSYVGGVDGWTFLDRDRVWVVNGWAGVSRVQGTPERMIALQRSSTHYFQRPDAAHLSVDSSATSLTGWAGRLLLNKQKGNVLLNTAIGVVSPAFDLNDVGFQARSDLINTHFSSGYRWTDPGKVLRRTSIYGAGFGTFDFEGNPTWLGLWSLLELQFLNYYEFELSLAYNPQTVNNRRTRGGPLMLNLPGFEILTEFRTDRRKPWVLSFQGWTYQSDSGSETSLSTDLTWKPAPNIDVTLGPAVSIVDEPAQWVNAYDDPLATETFGRRYVFAEMRQVTTSANLRLNWTFTPQLSFQLFAQPLFSAGDFTGYKELARARSFDFRVYGEQSSTLDPFTLLVDPDGPGEANPLDLEDQNFNFRSLRGNAVLRWEYRPGSVLYLVWTQLRSHSDDDGRFRLSRSFDRLWNAEPDNIFMVKLTYWLG